MKSSRSNARPRIEETLAVEGNQKCTQEHCIGGMRVMEAMGVQGAHVWKESTESLF